MNEDIVEKERRAEFLKRKGPDTRKAKEGKEGKRRKKQKKQED